MAFKFSTQSLPPVSSLFFYFSTCLKYFKAVIVFLGHVASQEVFVWKLQSGKGRQNKQVD